MRTATIGLILISVLLGGCASSKDEIFPVDSNITMMDIWRTSSGGNANLIDARSTLRRPIDPDIDLQTPYSRDSVNEIKNHFRRLPNPDLVMYVFPHLSGTDPVPVPGYTTVFPLHTKIEYALPGERIEEY